MKSVLIIGMGNFGRNLALKMQELKNDVMVIDQNETIIEEISHIVTDAHIGDCTNEAVLRSLGVRNFDICFVTIGENFQSSLEITSILKELGAKYVISKASRDIQAKFLLKNGADEVVYPDRDLAEKLAIRTSAKNVFDYIDLTSEYSIFEIPVPVSWTGNSIQDLNVRRKYHMSILAIKKDKNIMPMPKADYVFKENDHMIVLGRPSDVIKLASHI
jgi:trk system potassium uptake protein TrkA